MKKIFLAIAAVLAISSASAMEIGVTAIRNTPSYDSNAYGITLGEKFGPYGVVAGFDRTYNKTNDSNRFSVLGTYDLVKYGPVTFNVAAGGAYLRNSGTPDGFAFVSGVGASYQLTKELAATVDFRNQRGQAKISGLNGNSIVAGLKYSF